MCVAILQPVGNNIPSSILERCFRGNGDGGGLAFVAGGEVVIKKGFMKSNDFIDAYQNYREENPTSAFLVHCRIATKGVINADNCHPFQVKGGAMIHNGTLWVGGGRNDEKSDTREFAESLKNNLHKANVAPHKAEIGAAIRSTNRLAFLYKDGTTVIINDYAPAAWRDGIWYSNTYWDRS